MNSINYCVVSALFKNRNPTHLIKNKRKKKKNEWAQNGLLLQTIIFFMKNHKYKLLNFMTLFMDGV